MCRERKKSFMIMDFYNATSLSPISFLGLYIRYIASFERKKELPGSIQKSFNFPVFSDLLLHFFPPLDLFQSPRRKYNIDEKIIPTS